MVYTYSTGQARAAAAQARFGTIFSIAWDVDPSRDARGRYTTFQSEMIPLNRSLSEQLRDQVADKIESRIMRRAVSTGRLVTATRDPKNSVDDYADASRWAVLVGVTSWLDSSPAKYWRTIEEGSADVYRGGRGMIGLQLPMGKWGESIVGFYGNRWGEQPLAGAPFTRYGVNDQGKLRPYVPRKNKKKSKYVVKREIPAMLAYFEVWNSGSWPRRFEDAWRWALDEALVSGKRPTGVLKTR